MKLIGITGPTGAGKTTALRVLEELGGVVIDADAVYHQLTASSPALRAALEERFGPVYTPAGQLDRKKLGGVVFADPAALADLNAITHRFVGEEIDRILDQARQRGCPAAAIDAIALIESGLGARCDALVAVLAPAEVRVRRIMAREGISEEYARARVAAQQGEEFYRAHCPYCLVNDGDDPAAFAARARALFESIL
jgi:dephospho-CoA kinase